MEVLPGFLLLRDLCASVVQFLGAWLQALPPCEAELAAASRSAPSGRDGGTRSCALPDFLKVAVGCGCGAEIRRWPPPSPILKWERAGARPTVAAKIAALQLFCAAAGVTTERLAVFRFWRRRISHGWTRTKHGWGRDHRGTESTGVTDGGAARFSPSPWSLCLCG
jgi:hypothetical protein